MHVDIGSGHHVQTRDCMKTTMTTLDIKQYATCFKQPFAEQGASNVMFAKSGSGSIDIPTRIRTHVVGCIHGKLGNRASSQNRLQQDQTNNGVDANIPSPLETLYHREAASRDASNRSIV
jgi:hypothetical protein